MLVLVASLLVLLFTSIQSSWHTATATNLTGFISEIRNTLRGLSQFHKQGRWVKRELRRYNLTDTLIARQRQIQLNNFCIQTRIHFSYLQICASDSDVLESGSFLIKVHYITQILPYLTAYIFDIRATNHILSGTDIMLLVHHLLKGMGVRTCSLINGAEIRYELEGNVEGYSVPLIYLRCIRGKTTDWYSDFGYFNEHREQIATEMRQIHDSPHRNASCDRFGPYLLALWNKENKADFRTALRDNRWRFLRLHELRNRGYWFAHLYEIRPRAYPPSHSRILGFDLVGSECFSHLCHKAKHFSLDIMGAMAAVYLARRVGLRVEELEPAAMASDFGLTATILAIEATNQFMLFAEDEEEPDEIEL